MFYGVGETIKNGISLLYTKIFWPQARLIRLPIYARTKRNIIYGKGFTTGYACRISASKESKIEIGENVILGDYVQIQSSHSVKIGNNVLFASRIFVGDSNHGIYSGNNQTDPSSPPNDRPLQLMSIAIGNNVWIGNNVSIIGNVVIGDGVVVGANSVVNKNLESNCIYAGIPAKKIKQWNPKTEKWEKV